MIDIDGVQHGRADEVATALSAPGSKVTPAMVRRWHQRGKLPAHRAGRAVLYPLLFAGLVEAQTRDTPRGRPRAA